MKNFVQGALQETIYFTVLFKNNASNQTMCKNKVMKTNTPYMVTSHNYGLHNNNVCVAKERSIKDMIGYNNLYITMKNCVQGTNIIKHVCWKACKG